MRISDPPPGWRVVKRCPDDGVVFRPNDEPARNGRAPATRRNGNAPKPPKPAKPKRMHPTLQAAIDAAARSVKGKHADTWTYHLADGAKHFHVVRFNLPDGSKQFRPIRIERSGDGAVFALGDPPGPLPLYRLPSVLKRPDDVVYVVEGERCAKTLRALGAKALSKLGPLATTSAHGAKSASKTDWTPLRGRDVVILPDNDQPGAKYAADVKGILHELGCRVRIVVLPDLPAGGDVVDFIEDRRTEGKDDAAIRAEIEALIECAPAEAIAEEEAPMNESPRLQTVRMADVQSETLRWLWPGRIPLGKLTLFAGDPGLGKSFLTMDIAARVSTGAGWPDRPGERSEPGGVLLLTAEDGLSDTVRPRLDAAGANCARIEAIEAVTMRGGRERSLNLADDLALIEQRIIERGDVRLLIIDPISAYCGRTDSHTNAEVRGLLAPIAKLAEKHGVAVIAVTHLNKGAGGRAMQRSMGSIAFIAAARAGWLIVEDESDPSRRLMLPVKMNLAQRPSGLAFTLQGDATDPAGGMPRIAWSSERVEVSADEALARIEGHGGDDARSERDAAADWLRQELADGPRPANEVKQAADDNDFSASTLKRAKKAIGVKTKRIGFGPGSTCHWGLPGTWNDHRGSNTPIEGQHSNTVPYGPYGEFGPLCDNEDGQSTPKMPMSQPWASSEQVAIFGTSERDTEGSAP